MKRLPPEREAAFIHFIRCDKYQTRLALSQLVVRTQYVDDFVLVKFFHVVTSRAQVFTRVEFSRFFSEYFTDSSSHSQTRV